MELHRPIGEAPIALAHSLAGSSATVGFADLSQLARPLEHALIRSQAIGHGTREEARLFVDAAEEIRRLLHQFAAGFLKEPSPELLQRLADHELSSARRLEAVDRGRRARRGRRQRSPSDAPRSSRCSSSTDAAVPTPTRPVIDAASRRCRARGRPPPSRPSTRCAPDRRRRDAPPTPHGREASRRRAEPRRAVDAGEPGSTFGGLAPSAPRPGRAEAARRSCRSRPAAPARRRARPTATTSTTTSTRSTRSMPSCSRSSRKRPGTAAAAGDAAARLGAPARHDRRTPAACMRTLHTLKGGARLAGAMRLGEMAHRLETAHRAPAGADAAVERRRRRGAAGARRRADADLRGAARRATRQAYADAVAAASRRPSRLPPRRRRRRPAHRHRRRTERADPGGRVRSPASRPPSRHRRVGEPQSRRALPKRRAARLEPPSVAPAISPTVPRAAPHAEPVADLPPIDWSRFAAAGRAGRAPGRPSAPHAARSRRCACARRCSTGWSTRPARSASRARGSRPRSARSRARSPT